MVIGVPTKTFVGGMVLIAKTWASARAGAHIHRLPSTSKIGIDVAGKRLRSRRRHHRTGIECVQLFIS